MSNVPLGADPALAHARVLVVDDNAGKRLALVSALHDAGFEARAVSSADAASAAGAAELAIVDLVLQGTSGFELARRLRSTAPALQVVLTSDYLFTTRQLERVDCGAIGFLPRPCALVELTAFLRTKLPAHD